MADKPTWNLDQIYWNSFREGAWPGLPNTLTYSFPTQVPDSYKFGLIPIQEGKSFSSFSLAQKSWAEFAVQQWADVVSIDFQPLGYGGGGQIRFMNTEDHNGGSAHAESINSNRRGDIWVHSDVKSNFNLDIGHNSVKTLIHELGHALGLQHPGDYDASDGPSNYDDDAPYAQDSHQYTIMSYFGAGNTGGFHPSAPQTPLLHDIYNIQRMYGANMSTRDGNTTYGFNSNTDNAVFNFTYNTEPALAIWDAGGVDWLDLSGSDQAATIALTPGEFSNIMGGVKNVAIAYETWIENARGGTANDYISGNELANKLYGMDGNDTINGGAADDTVRGHGGNDSLLGGTGNDSLVGGSGNDTLSGYHGNDTLRGENDHDTLIGGNGQDVLDGGFGNDWMSGGYGLDTFYGSNGSDTVSFAYSNANWTIHLDAGASGTATMGNGTENLYSIENIVTGHGHDVVHGSSKNNHISSNFGNDRLYGYEGDDTLEGGWGNDRLEGHGGDNRLEGGEGNDTLYHGVGDNYIDGGSGYDILRFNGGFDTGVNLYLHNAFSSQKIVDKPGTGNDIVSVIKGIERAEGTVHDDTIKGSWAVDNTLIGNAGDDEIWGFSSNNTLSGGYGNDTLFSGTGNDTMNGGSGTDMVSFEHANAGVTLLIGFAGAQNIAGFGTDKFVSIEGAKGSDHNDFLHGSSVYNVILGGDGRDFIDGRKGNDSLEGGAGRDTVLGGSGEDTIRGNDGNDSLDGQGSDDTLYGGSGNDTLVGGGGDDYINGGGDLDTATYAGASGFVAIDLDISGAQNTRAAGFDQLASIEAVVGTGYGDSLKAKSNGSRLFGEGGDDNLYGRDGNDSLVGASGDDTIHDTGGNDIINGGAGTDMVSYTQATAGVVVDLKETHQQTVGAGFDTLISIEQVRGTGFNDWLAGTDGINELHGLNGNDIMFGRSQNDSLNGGNGDDILDGGNGNDNLNGSFGVDAASYLTALAGVTVDLAITGWQYTSNWSEWDKLINIENLIGSFFNDTLRGDDNDNVINAGAGDDLIEARGGNDTVVAGLGGGSDEYDGGSGVDLLRFDDVSSALTIDLNAVANQVSGADVGADQVSNFENIVAGAGNDTVEGTFSANHFDGRAGDDLLRGRNGNDTLVGGDGNDTLRGGGHHDRLEGGAGNDLLTGNWGQDTFAFGIGTGHDIVTDFNPNADRLDFVAYGFDSFEDDVLANATNVRGSMLIDFGPAGMITVNGMSVGDFAADQVLI